MVRGSSNSDNNTAITDDLKSFFKNTQKALQTHTVKELNDAVTNFLKNKDNKYPLGVDIVLDTVSAYFGISRRILVFSTARGNIQKARYIAYILLNKEFNIPTRYIAKTVFHKWPNNVMVALNYFKKLQPEIKADKQFLETYELLKIKVKAK